MNQLLWTGVLVAWSAVFTAKSVTAESLTADSIAAEVQPRIINGIPTADYPAVGIVGTLNTSGFCTGTLISPRHVLTAAHCAEAMLMFGSEQSGFFQLGDDLYVTSRVIIHPDYRPSTFENDIAILELAEPVTNIDPIAFSVVPPVVGESVLIVGYGGQGTPQEGNDGSFGEKVVGITTIDQVRQTDLVWAFDDPSESNPAPGDSGGPVLVETAEGYSIVGLVSAGTRADAGLGDLTFCTRVDAFAGWILDIVLAETPDDDPTDPTDDDDPTEPPNDQDTDDQVDESEGPSDTRPASCHRERRRRPSGVHHRHPGRVQGGAATDRGSRHRTVHTPGDRPARVAGTTHRQPSSATASLPIRRRNRGDH